MPPTSPASSTASTISLPSLRQVDGVACWLEGVPPLSAPSSAPLSEGEDKGGAALGAKAGQADQGASASRTARKTSEAGEVDGVEIDELGSEGSVGAGAGAEVAGKVEGKGGKTKPVRACGPCKLHHTSCDHARPCQRCVHRGKESQCVDVPSRRGRNRLPAARAQHAAAAATQPSHDAQRAYAGGPIRHPNQFNPARYTSAGHSRTSPLQPEPVEVKPFVHREARMRPKPYEYHPQLGAAQPAYSQAYRFPPSPTYHQTPQHPPGYHSSAREVSLKYPTAPTGTPARSSSAGSSSYQSQATTADSAYSDQRQKLPPTLSHVPTGAQTDQGQHWSLSRPSPSHAAPQPQRFTRMDQLALQAMRVAELERHQADAAAQAHQEWIARSRVEQSRYQAPVPTGPH